MIDCEAAGRGFAYVVGETAASELIGLTVRNGNPGFSGGAVLCIGASPRIAGCVFDANTGIGAVGSGGGAVYASGGSPSFGDCVFLNNHNPSSDGVGGAIALSDCGVVTITGCTFENNTTVMTNFAAGGAVFAWFGSSVAISGCDFHSNTSRSGGAAAIIQTLQATISTSVFTENTATNGGGLDTSSQSLLVSDCGFSANDAEQGAGADLGFYSSEFERCVFQDNAATLWGGAVAAFQESVDFTDCVFSANTAAVGGALLASETQMDVGNCTFHANDADEGSVIRTRIGSFVGATHSIFAFNLSPIASCNSGSVNLACSDVFGTVGGDWVGCVAGQSGIANNFSADPLFCDKDGKDFHIRSSSPCAPPGVTGCGLVGALPVGCGPVSLEPASWAAVKSRYRGE